MDSFYTEEELKTLGLKHYGKNVKISRKAMIYNTDQIEIGNHVRIDDFCILSGRIQFGDYIHIGVFTQLSGSTGGMYLHDFSGVSYNSTILANSDDYSGEFLTNPMVPMKYRKIAPAPVVFEKHALVATRCAVMPGITLGEGCAVGAMSLVLKDVDPWSIYVGIPAKWIKERKRDLIRLEKALREELGQGKEIF
jgi:galactoside O-acetyltransferase